MQVLLARYCYRLSVRPSVTLMYRGQIGWTSSKLITRIISLGSSLLGATTSAISPRGTPLKSEWNRGGVVLSRKPAISLKRGKKGPRLLLMTNRKPHSRFRLMPYGQRSKQLRHRAVTLRQDGFLVNFIGFSNSQ